MAKSKKADEPRVNVRVTPDLLERLDALIAKADRIPECRLSGSPDRSKVARVALDRGIEVLERETARPDGGRGR
jgi:hypothetical protein